MTNSSYPARLIMFDGVCNLCNGVIQFIIKHDPKAMFSFASLQSVYAQTLLERFDLSGRDLDSFVYIRDGMLYKRSTAALYLARDMGGLGKILFFFMLVPPPIRDMVYDQIARYRYKLFGKKDSCMIPTPDLKARFMDTSDLVDM